MHASRGRRQAARTPPETSLSHAPKHSRGYDPAARSHVVAVALRVRRSSRGVEVTRLFEQAFGVVKAATECQGKKGMNLPEFLSYALAGCGKVAEAWGV